MLMYDIDKQFYVNDQDKKNLLQAIFVENPIHDLNTICSVFKTQIFNINICHPVNSL